MSGNLDLDLNVVFGLKNDVAATENIQSPDIMLLTTDNDEPDTATHVQIPPQKTIFWYQPPFKTILWKLEFVELPPIEYAKVDWGNMTKDIDWGDLIYDPPEMIEDPNPPETIPIPEPITIPFPGWETAPLPPIIICDPTADTSSE